MRPANPFRRLSNWWYWNVWNPIDFWWEGVKGDWLCRAGKHWAKMDAYPYCARGCGAKVLVQLDDGTLLWGRPRG